MAVHLPLSAEAQAEARILMLSSNNLLSPAHGRPLVTPTQDMIIGAYYLTEERPGAAGEGRVFRRIDEIERALDAGELDLHAPIEFRTPELAVSTADGGRPTYTRTTPGRVLFNETLPHGFGFQNRPIRKGEMTTVVDELASRYGNAEVARSLDALKDLCFRFAARSGLTISVDDIKTPPEKDEILDRYEEEAQKVETQFRRGIITDGERRQKEVEIWTYATACRHGGLTQGRQVQSDRHDGGLGCPREHDAGPSDRRYARSGGQSPRRHDPPSDQVELPRRPHDAGVLHRDAGRP